MQIVPQFPLLRADGFKTLFGPLPRVALMLNLLLQTRDFRVRLVKQTLRSVHRVRSGKMLCPEFLGLRLGFAHTRRPRFEFDRTVIDVPLDSLALAFRVSLASHPQCVLRLLQTRIHFLEPQRLHTLHLQEY